MGKKSTHIPIGLLFSVLIFLELLVVVGGWKYKENLMTSSTLNMDKKFLTLMKLDHNVYRLRFILSNISNNILLSMIGAIILIYRKEKTLKGKVILIKFREKVICC